MQHNAGAKSVVVEAHPVCCWKEAERHLGKALCLCFHCLQQNARAECMVGGVMPLWLHHKTGGRQKEAKGLFYAWVSVVQHNETRSESTKLVG